MSSVNTLDRYLFITILGQKVKERIFLNLSGIEAGILDLLEGNGSDSATKAIGLPIENEATAGFFQRPVIFPRLSQMSRRGVSQL